MICSTKAIESVNARIHRAVKARGALPERAGRAQVRLHGDHQPGPHRRWKQTLDDAVETRVERVRDRLRRPPRRPTQVVPLNPSYTVRLQTQPGSFVRVTVRLESVHWLLGDCPRFG